MAGRKRRGGEIGGAYLLTIPLKHKSLSSIQVSINNHQTVSINNHQTNEPRSRQQSNHQIGYSIIPQLQAAARRQLKSYQLNLVLDVPELLHGEEGGVDGLSPRVVGPRPLALLPAPLVSRYGRESPREVKAWLPLPVHTVGDGREEETPEAGG
jgi:hypothetical protein